MKMDDKVEGEIFYDIFVAHIQICRRYAKITSSNIIDMFIPGPDETMRTKMLKPAPFLFIIFLLIVISVVIQNSTKLRRCLYDLHSIMVPSVGISLGNIADSNGLGSLIHFDKERAQPQEVKEGLVGVYAMQGRRENMEDRFSVLLDVPVGQNKSMSFFGVYDGHGGQFVAEYLKTHLFKNTIKKIKELRSDIYKNEANINNLNNCMSSKNNGIVKQEIRNKRNSITSSRSNSVTASQISDSSASILNNNNNKDKEETESFSLDKESSEQNSQGNDNKITQRRVSKDANANEANEKTNLVEDVKEDIIEEEPLKKDDTYNTLNIRKKSLANINYMKEVKEKKDDSKSDDIHQYVDMNKNINYTKLLTDQILNIDSQVVEKCKRNTDLSGSTAVVAVLDGELLVVCNVGDSRAVMADQRGRAIPLSFDHKPNQLKERRRIKEAGGFITFTGVWRVAGILATSRAIGDFPLKHPRPLVTAEPDILTFSLHDHKAEFVILASDGLWDVMTNEEAVAYVRTRLHRDEDFGAKSVALHAYERGSQDNITVAVINFSKMLRQEDKKR